MRTMLGSKKEEKEINFDQFEGIKLCSITPPCGPPPLNFDRHSEFLLDFDQNLNIFVTKCPNKIENLIRSIKVFEEALKTPKIMLIILF